MSDGPVTMRDGSVTADPRLDRLVEFDERSRLFAAVEKLEIPADLRTKVWKLLRAKMQDQGSEGACVEYGICHAVAALPFNVALKLLKLITKEHRIYWPAQQDDPWPGGSYPGASPTYEGTSVLSGLKQGVKLGLFDSFHWCFGIDDVLRTLSHTGTVVFGLPWKSGMFEPRPSGLLEVTGNTEGGHCVAGNGIYLPKGMPAQLRRDGVREPVVKIPQSWGLDHGHRGFVYLKASDLHNLLNESGEAATPTRLA